jgi:hypothetical protein
MSDLRDRLERLGARAPSAPDAFERLERARRRRERNRRITAGTVALLVAIVGSVAAVAAFTGSEPRAGSGPEDGFVAIWPESTYEDALEAQALVDAGEPSLAWRLDARETARAFARDALGWSDISIEVGLDDLRTEVLVRSPGRQCGPVEQVCHDPRHAKIVLVRLDGASNGIWSVVSVTSPEFETAPAAGSEIVAGEQLQLVTRGSAVGVNLYVAFVGLGSCAGWEHDAVMPGTDLSVVAPRPPHGAEACPIALVVLHNDPADQDVQGLGRQLLEYGYRTSLHGVLAVPLRLAPGASGTVPDVASVTCEGSKITVDTSVVAAQPDGIHIDIRTIGDTGVSFRVAEDAGSDAAVISPERGATDPTGEVVLLSPPGRYVLSCTAPQGEVGMASLDVIDPNGSFVSAEPECSGGEAWGTAPAYAPGAVGDRGDPVEIARARLTGLQDIDVIERAGYPKGDGTALVRVVRDGAVIAKAELFDDGQGGWLLSSLEGCGDARFGWTSDASEPTGSAAELCEPPSAELVVTVDEGVFVSDVGCVSAPAGEPLTITLDNRDSSGHNIWIYARGSDEPVFRGAPCFGPDQITYSVQPLEAGRYRLVDEMNRRGPELALVVA